MDKITEMIEAVKQLEQVSHHWKSLHLQDFDSIISAWSELNSRIDEAFASSYIQYTLHTDDPEIVKVYQQWIQSQEVLSPLWFSIEKNFFDYIQPFQQELHPYLVKRLKNAIELYVPENIPLKIQEDTLSQQYQKEVSVLEIEYQNKVYTIPQASSFLENTNRETRKTVWTKIQESYLHIQDKVLDIFSKQILLRNEMAQNLKFDNYRDLMHTQKNRFAYEVKDVQVFHDSILEVVVPYTYKIYKRRAEKLKQMSLRPYDTQAELYPPSLGKFTHSQEDMIEKAEKVLQNLDADIYATLLKLKKNGHLDLLSRKHKAPGGYNFPLLESKSSFIFMNSKHSFKDMVVLFHELGHAFHFEQYQSRSSLWDFAPPSETAELASMSLELLSMSHWESLFENKKDFLKVKIQQLEQIILFFPWMSCVDAFQQKVYTQKSLTKDMLGSLWSEIFTQYHPWIDYSDLEHIQAILWQKQPHIIEMPFYYVEYGIAQLGALQIYQNYKQDPKQTLDKWKYALSLGSSLDIQEIYEAAGITLAFHKEILISAMQNLFEELQSLYEEIDAL